MKKKLLTTAGALVLAVAMATSAFAADFVGSVSGTDVPSSRDVTTSNGATITITPLDPNDAVTAKALADLEKYTDAANMLAQNNVDLTTALTAEAKEDIQNGSMDYLTAFDVSADKAGDFTMKVPNLAEGQVYVLMHWNGSAWEVVGSGKAGANGEVIGRFSSLSPVVVLAGTVREPTAPATSTTTSSAPATTTATAPVTGTVVYAPQTGVNGLEYVAMFGVLASLVVLAFAYKKINE